MIFKELIQVLFWFFLSITHVTDGAGFLTLLGVEDDDPYFLYENFDKAGKTEDLSLDAIPGDFLYMLDDRNNSSGEIIEIALMTENTDNFQAPLITCIFKNRNLSLPVIRHWGIYLETGYRKDTLLLKPVMVDDAFARMDSEQKSGKKQQLLVIFILIISIMLMLVIVFRKNNDIKRSKRRHFIFFSF